MGVVGGLFLLFGWRAVCHQGGIDFGASAVFVVGYTAGEAAAVKAKTEPDFAANPLTCLNLRHKGMDETLGEVVVVKYIKAGID